MLENLHNEQEGGIIQFSSSVKIGNMYMSSDGNGWSEIAFYDQEGNKIGIFTWGDGNGISFSGECEESAKVFIEALNCVVEEDELERLRRVDKMVKRLGIDVDATEKILEEKEKK